MNNPFDGLSELQKNKLLKKLESHTYKYNKNEEILSTLKNTNIICILLEGSAKISNINYLGEETIVEELYENSVFGTNISNIDNIECQIKAITDCTIIIIDYVKLIKSENLNYSYFNIFLFNLFQIINDKFKETNDRIRILEKKQIRDKLLEYFEIQHKKSRLKSIYLPFSLKDLADYIAVNRSAMFRELKHLKEERLIEINDRKITLLYK